MKLGSMPTRISRRVETTLLLGVGAQVSRCDALESQEGLKPLLPPLFRFPQPLILESQEGLKRATFPVSPQFLALESQEGLKQMCFNELVERLVREDS